MATNLAHKRIRIPSNARLRTTSVGCTCPTSTGSQQFSKSHASNSRATSWDFSIHSANLHHDRHCLHYAWDETSWSMRLRLAYCSKLLARAVEASLSLTRGAGGIALSPTLQLRCLVPFDSPAFTLVRDPFPRGMTFDDKEIVANQRLQILRQMFQDGKASPYDVDVNGNTLLHVSDPG